MTDEGAPLFALTAAQEALCAEVRATAAEVLVPIAARGRPGDVNRPLLAAMAQAGLLARLFPVDAGGSQPDHVRSIELCLLRESLAQACTEAETALALQGLGTYPILQSGRRELIDRVVPRVVAGEAVAAFALTEPEAGSDAGALQLRADRFHGGWLLHGEKIWISNAPQADVYSVFARTTPGTGSRGVTAFAVDGASPGLGGERLELVAPHPIGRLTFDGVHVPDECVLGEVGDGFRVAMRTLDLFRPSVGAFAVGMARAALDIAIEHAGNRVAFGAPLRAMQGVSHQLAEMATRTEAARLLVLAAAAAYDRGEPGVTMRAAMAKLLATETAQYVVDAAVQICGARALQRGHPLEHLYREVRAPRIYEGASEVQRTIIARELYR
ncbi:MAG: acyl-CoA dehydrogenase family protein [Frankiaceae bacterium]